MKAILFLVVMTIFLSFFIMSCSDTSEGENDNSNEGGGNDPNNELPPPSDEENVELENGVVVTTAVYTGQIKLPENLDIAFSEIEIFSFFGTVQQPDKNGIFKVRMNKEATGLIMAKYKDAPLLMSVFPKHPDLIQVNPEVSTKSSALAIIGLMPGFMIREPRIDALTLEYLSNTSEIEKLTSSIEQGMTDSPNVLINPTKEIYEDYLAVIEMITQYSTFKTKSPFNCGNESFPNEDTDQPYFSDSDENRNDWVYVEAGLDAPKSEIDFSMSNTLPRWVAFYFNENNTDFVSLIKPRNFEIPGSFDLLWDIIKYEISSWKIVFGAKDLSGIWEEVQEEIQAIAISHFDCSYLQIDDVLLPGSDSISLNSYTFGKEWIEELMLFPSSLTVFTEIVIPILSIVMDVSTLWVDPHVGVEDCLDDISGEEVNLFISHLSEFGSIFEEIIQYSTNGEMDLASEAMFNISKTIATSKDFWGFFAHCLRITPSTITKLFGETIGEFFESFNKTIKLVDAGIGVANAIVSINYLCGISDTYDSKDSYEIILPPAGPSDLTVSSQGQDSILLTWQDNSDNEEGFQIERKIGNAGTWQEIKSTSSDASEYLDTGLSCNTEHFYRIRSYIGDNFSDYL